MTSYVIRNGKLQLRQKDFNMPNYRIIPYKSTINASKDDYFSNTINELQKQVEKYKVDYRNLTQTMWKTLSQIDRSSYDMNNEEIYDKISLIRSLNAYEPEEESLKFSAIVKVDDNSTLYPTQSHINNNSQHNTLNQIQNAEIRKQSLYQIREEQECCSNSSKLSAQNMLQLGKKSSNQQKYRQSLPRQQNTLPHRRTLSELSGQKCQNRRTSFLLKQKISLAFHQQQQLRQLLEQELQKLTQQIDLKNDYLTWTIEQLKLRNSLIEKLKNVLIKRDEEFQKQEKQLNLAEDQLKNMEKMQKSQQILQQIDRQVGILINSLIQRTQQTSDDFQYLTKSVQQTNYNNVNEENNNIEDGKIENPDDLKLNVSNQANQSIYLDQFMECIKQQEEENSKKQNQKLKDQLQNHQLSKFLGPIRQSQNQNQENNIENSPVNSRINEPNEDSIKISIIQKIRQLKQQDQNSQQSSFINSQNFFNRSNMTNQQTLSVLQPRKIDNNIQQKEQQQQDSITLLTKQHFLRAQKQLNEREQMQKQNQNRNKKNNNITKKQNYSPIVIENVRMIQSLEGNNE